MATPQEKLAESLDALRRLQDRGVVAIRAAIFHALTESACSKTVSCKRS